MRISERSSWKLLSTLDGPHGPTAQTLQDRVAASLQSAVTAAARDAVRALQFYGVGAAERLLLVVFVRLHCSPLAGPGKTILSAAAAPGPSIAFSAIDRLRRSRKKKRRLRRIDTPGYKR